MRVSRAYLGVVAALQLLGGCGSPATNDLFAGEPSSSGGASTSGGGTSLAGSSAGAAAGTSGSSGGAASAGSGNGAGGSAAAGTFSGEGGFASDEEAIDDMEDGDAQLLPQAGRDGLWYVIADPTPGAWTSPGAGVDFSMAWNATARGESQRAAQLAGGNFMQWGAGLIFNLRSWADGPLPSYDASAYSGLSFYGRSAQGSLELTVYFPDVNTHQDGGVCGTSPKPPCFRHYHSTVTLSSAWQKFRIPFATLKQADEPKTAFTASTLYAVQFSVKGDVMFDFAIDDVAFIKN